MKICDCGNQVASNARFCPKCGKRFTHPFTKFVAVFLAFCGVMIVVGLIVGNSQSGGSSNASTSTPHTSTTSNEKPLTTPSVPVSKWQYEQSEDKMRHAVSRYASLESDNRVEFGFPYNGGSSATIVLRKSPQHGNLYLQISKGQFICGYPYCSLKANFDNHSVQSFSASEPSDGSANVLFINDEAQFLRSLRKAKTVTVEAAFYQEGNRQFEFSPAGLEWK